MSFSHEVERDGKQFVENRWKKDQFVTNVYCKPTFSSVYTHFESFLSGTYKFGLVYTLVYRSF